MLFFQRIIKKSAKGARFAVFIAFLLNTIMISFFIMTITGIDNIVNDKLSPNDMNQIMTVINSMALTGIITIIFLQWIAWSLYTALFESRNSFIMTIKMIGYSQKNIFKVFFIEFIILQICVMPFSFLFSYGFYNVIMKAYDFPSSININAIIVSIAINFIVTFFSLHNSYRKSKKHLSYNTVSKGTSKKTIGKFEYVMPKLRKILGIIAMLTSIFLTFMNGSSPYYYLLFSISAVILWNEIVDFFCHVINVCFQAKYHIVINFIKGHLKSISVISYTIIFGISLVFGINTFIINARNIAYNSVIENIGYSTAIQLESICDEQSLNLKIGNENTALLFLENSVASSNLGIMAIDQCYLNEYETIKLKSNNNLKSTEFYSEINNSAFDGIILPQHLLSDNDIGKTITLSINENQLSFVIKEGYYPNDYSTQFAYVSKEYVESSLRMPDKANIIFQKESIDLTDFVNIKNTIIHTKKDMADQSYNKVVQSTFILEITAIVVLLTSFFMLANFIFLSAGKNKIDIARMRCFGLSRKFINVIYILFYTLIIISSIIPATFLSLSSAMSMTSISLGRLFSEFGFVFSWQLYFAMIGIYIVFVLGMYFFVTNKTMKKYIYLIRIKTEGN